ncbi:hypothetical protein [uncultured Winogradskyella sp.]|uniref:hypothetical protein n=1 Tax=uncultured Winogradskyella sp. TaxID=395353 RepID=UPI00262224C2|nr:hypothetical protein [uncultured Winogradskyella sp.]
MIKFDGYYLLEPKKIYEGRIKKYIYSVNAYRFLKNGYYERISKIELLEHITDFTIDDFIDDKITKGQFKINDNKMILKKTDEFSQDVILDIINENKLYINFLKKEAYFVSFEKVYETYGDKKPNDKKIIEEVLKI